MVFVPTMRILECYNSSFCTSRRLGNPSKFVLSIYNVVLVRLLHKHYYVRRDVVLVSGAL